MKTMNVYNLVFPDYVNELRIGPYIFKRVSGYKGALQKLYHRASVTYEFKVTCGTGMHQATAVVECPDEEPDAVLDWDNDKATMLLDVLLLLSLFTRREVFLQDWAPEEEVCIRRDPRIATWGGQLQFAIRPDLKRVEFGTGKIFNDKDFMISGKSEMDFNQGDFGLENATNDALRLICNKDWRKEYDNGYFLFLYRGAIFQPFVESAFTACWTIWEHIFAVKNIQWLDKKSIRSLASEDKVAFILNKYFLKEMDATAKCGIRKICKARNRIVHSGKNDEEVTNEELMFLIELTEQLVAVIFGLKESNMFKTLGYKWEDPRKPK